MSLSHVLQILHSLLAKCLIRFDFLLFSELGIECLSFFLLLLLLRLLSFLFLMDSLQLSLGLLLFGIVGPHDLCEMGNGGGRIGDSVGIALLFLWGLLRWFSVVPLDKVVSVRTVLLLLGEGLAQLLDEVAGGLLIFGLQFLAIGRLLAGCSRSFLLLFDLNVRLVTKGLRLFKLVELDCLSRMLLTVDRERTNERQHSEDLLRGVCNLFAIHAYLIR